jgi:putative transposase
MVCQVLGVPKSSYYEYRLRRNKIDAERLRLRALVTQVFKASRCAAGSRTIKDALNQQGTHIGRYKVRRLMAEAALVSKQPGKHRYKVAEAERVDIPNPVVFNPVVQKSVSKPLLDCAPFPGFSQG